ncbi:MAG: thiamine-phosphate kinase [Planctomycetes bacterium]|nr:thiamine-phosphate kinase [Planctomycetota bacterium]
MALRERDVVELVRSLAARFPRSAGLLVGIGDDAAIADSEGRTVVVTTDLLLDGIDFVLAECGFWAAGRKAMAKNLSDVAAMGCEPWLAFTSTALPPGTTGEEAHALFDALTSTAAAHGCTVAGGDTKRSSGPLVVNVTVIGRARARPPLVRSGARVGDVVCVTGEFGGSILGHHLSFEPRVWAGLRLNEVHGAHAAIDVSDGLEIDLVRLADASGVGVFVELNAIPIRAAADVLAQRDGVRALEHALHDGEDYELIVALPEHVVADAVRDPELGTPLTVIGRFTREREWIGWDGCIGRTLGARGFEHEFGSEP